jgi:hypothetical protein
MGALIFRLHNFGFAFILAAVLGSKRQRLNGLHETTLPGGFCVSGTQFCAASCAFFDVV